MSLLRFVTSILAFCFACTVFAQGSSANWAPMPMTMPKGVFEAIPIGPKEPTDTLHISVSLPYRDPIGMKVFVDSVSNPKSGNYRKFVSPSQVGAMFGPTPATVRRIAAYLSAFGICVRFIGQSRLSILADATVAQAQSAFNTSIEEFLPITGKATFGEKRFSFTTLPCLPSSICSSAIYVGGLEDFTRPTPHTILTPLQLRTLYSVAKEYSGGFQGIGRTVAISNFVGYRLSDIIQEYQHFGLPIPSGGLLSNIVVKSINGKKGGQVQENAEAQIDIQCVLAMAPLCTLIIYDDAADSDLVGTLSKEADDNTADIISESYGWSSPDPNFYLAAHNQHLAMSAQGITYTCASGDNGAASLAGLPYPDSDPDVLVVGGTTVTTDDFGDRTSEVGWSGSGGGWVVSGDAFNAKPSYQQQIGVFTGIPYRLTPDIALDADPQSGFEVYVDGVLQGWGGTSCASPTLAGALADCEQQIIAGGGLASGAQGNQRFGRIQDLLYSYNGDPTVFFDITSGSNGTLPNGSASAAQPGWDTVTGWGALVFSGFVAKELGTTGLAAITFPVASVAGGNSAVGTVHLGSPAPAGGVLVTLNSNSKVASVPSSVLVPVGTNSANFTLTSSEVNSEITVSITGSSAGVSLTADIAIAPADLATASVAPGAVVGGEAATGTITLNAHAPKSGVTVELSSNTASAVVPTWIRVPAGAISATFKVSTKAVSSDFSATITAKHGATTSSGALIIKAPVLTQISLSPSTAIGGKGAVIGSLSLDGPAPTGGVSVTLATSNSIAAKIPAAVKLPAGAKSARFTISTQAVLQATTVIIQGILGNASQGATLTLNPPAFVSLSVSPTAVRSSSSTKVTGTVTIGSPAGIGGIPIIVQSSNPSVASVNVSATIPQGKTSGTFAVIYSAVKVKTVVQFTSSVGAVTKSATLTLMP